MKKFCIFLLSIISLFVQLKFAHARTWTAGTDTVEGDFVRIESDGQTVVIKKVNGRSVRIDKRFLSEEDKNYLSLQSDKTSTGNQDGNSPVQNFTQRIGNKGTLNSANCYALLIGVDEYNDSRDNLRYCGSDMKLLAKSLEKVGFPKDQVHVMTSDAPIGNRPTKANIIKALDSLILLMDESCTLFVAFGGHGLTDESTNKAYLCPSDTDVTDKSSLISRDEVFEKLDSCKASCKVFLVDACRNMVSLKRGLGIHALSDPVGDKQYGFVLLSSCNKEQYAHESPDLGGGHGVFTYFLTEGLKGKAADIDGDVTVMSLFTYTSKATKNYVYRNFNHAVQQPTINQGEEMSDFLLVRVKDNPEAEEFYQLAEKYATAEHGNGEQDWEKAIRLYRQAASMRHVRAMICLGYCHEKGFGIYQDYDEAFNWYMKAAQQNSPEAFICIGNCYKNGYGVSKDEQEAQKWFEKGFQGLIEQGDKNDPVTQYYLGHCYAFGYGTPKNVTESIDWFLKAAQQGDARSQCNLGAFYQFGNGVQKDNTEAINWYHKAAQQGLAIAQNNLGLCYEEGIGVTQDFIEAVNWYSKAAQQGYAIAQFHLAFCYEKGRGVSRNYTKAVGWYHKAAEQGEPKAQCSLGICYEKGFGVPEDKTEAVKWYRKSAEQGIAMAQNNLGNCYFYGIGVSEDKAEAVQWYLKAAQQGYIQAQNNLGNCYENGYGVPKNKAEADKWYLEAAKQMR